MKKILFLIAVVVFGIWLYSHQGNSGSAKLEPCKYHRTVAEWYMDAILNQDQNRAIFYSSGMAKSSGYGAIMAELRGYPGRFTKYTLMTGGAPSGDYSSGRALMYGANGDMFCVLAFTMQRINGNWYISEVGTKRE
jgi:hypothetical protein